YLINVTGRLDGSSRFGPQFHYTGFYAVGAAFVFSELGPVRHGLPFLSFGKLRANMGVTGNDQVGDHGESGFAPTNVPFLNNIPGFFTSNKIAAGSGWETILKKEIALDLGFLHDRYLLTIAWYLNQSKDQLLPVDPGSPYILKNWPAVLRNTGWEFSVSARLIERRDLSWRIDLNVSVPVNRLVSLPHLTATPFAHLFVVGRSIDAVQGWHSTGVDLQTGIFTFEDRHHDR